jgi:OTU domain-containing protein 6
MGRRKRSHKSKPADTPVEEGVGGDDVADGSVETRNIWEYTEEELAELEGLTIENGKSDSKPQEPEREMISDEGPKDEDEEKEDDDESFDQTLPKVEKKRLRNLRRKQKRQELAEKERQKAVEASSRLRDLKEEERVSLKRLLYDRGLEIVSIPPDGNCLYAAVSDQLKRESHGEVDVGVEKLREICAGEMRMNKEEHAGFIELPNGWSFDDYIERGVLKSGYWGGHIEMVSLANAFSASIEILCADQETIVVGEGSNYHLVIAYLKKAFTLGEHYNSVARIEEIHGPGEEEQQQGEEVDILAE